GPVYTYYGLTNFFQNHRMYIRSYDPMQLVGNTRKNFTVVKEGKCRPYMTINNKIIAPCGTIANSLFNDSFHLFYLKESSRKKVELLNYGLAWPTDKLLKYSNPSRFPHDPAQAFSETIPPPHWKRPVYHLDQFNASNNGYVNENLIVWMRNSFLPDFIKTHGVLKPDGIFNDGLPAGNYSLLINYAYPVFRFNGTKRFIITNTFSLGASNYFILFFFCFVSILCFIISFALLYLRNKFHANSSV
ncbi:hypothetical protein HELRODRAFT_79446, partial [Helobdella robusta]|uniref:Cell cycle control protein 50A n=1 Tax=Helobdella robusta TaxID=6412 RepID=T1G3N9_HELRO